MENQETWTNESLQQLNEKAAVLVEPHLKNYGVDFIKNAIQIMPQKINQELDWEEFKQATHKLINALPTSDKADKESQKIYQKSLAAYKELLMKKYNMVAKGYYLTVWMPLGIGIGLPFGLMFKNIALGIPIGIGIGLAIGSGLDNKAKKENRQL